MFLVRLLNHVGCVVTFATWIGGLRGYVSRWIAWVCGSNFYIGCLGYVDQNIFYVGHSFYVDCVGQIFFACVNFFAWVKLFCRSIFFVSFQNFYLGQFNYRISSNKRVPNPPILLFYEDPLYCLSPFSNFAQLLPPLSLLPCCRTLVP